MGIVLWTNEIFRDRWCLEKLTIGSFREIKNEWRKHKNKLF